MLFLTLLFYALAAIAAVAGCYGISKLFKRRKQKLYKVHVCVGAVGFVLMLALVFWLVPLGFSEEVTMYIVEYMDVGLYKVTVAALFFFLVAAVRNFLLNFFYFNRDKEDKGCSFLAGYGFFGALVVALYSFAMLLFIGFTALGSKVESYDGGTFLFEDATVISTFEDPAATLLVIVAFAVYTVICLAVAEFLTRSSSGTYGFFHSAFIYMILALCETVVCCIFLFLASQWSMYAVVAVFALLAAVCVASVVFLYKYKEESPYKKQFDEEE